MAAKMPTTTPGQNHADFTRCQMHQLSQKMVFLRRGLSHSPIQTVELKEFRVVG
jgi:hypothetical protein